MESPQMHLVSGGERIFRLLLKQEGTLSEDENPCFLITPAFDA